MYTNADGLMGNDIEIEFQGCMGEAYPGISGTVETKLCKEIRSHVVLPGRSTLINKKKGRQRDGKDWPF